MAERPIDAMLRRAAAGRWSMHMPGHKGRGPYGDALYALDATEFALTDDLYRAEGAIAGAQRLYARATGAARCLFLTNGSTAGVHVMLQLWAREGDTVILPRNAHLSAVNACIGGGLAIRWVPLRGSEDGRAVVRPEDVLAAMDALPRARALLLTRPAYDGSCIGLEGLVAAAHARGIRAAVDEAHGAHLPWLEGLPAAAECGADAWTQSVHKTLPGLTGSAVLGLADAADEPRAWALLARTQTSSPSFLLLRSIDDARSYMEETGAARLRETARLADALRAELPGLGWRAAPPLPGERQDPTRLSIEAPQGGACLLRELAEQGVDGEMADARRAVLILTCMDGAESVGRVAEALRRIRPHGGPPADAPATAALPEAVMTVREAAMREAERVPLARAAGRVSAVSAGLYPPGIPLAVPGERLTEDILSALAGADRRNRFGTWEDTIECVR